MKWNIITQIGPMDLFAPPLGDDSPRINVAFQRPNDRWLVTNNAENIITDTLGQKLLPQVEDLLYIAMTVYTVDVRVPRKLSKDRWARHFILHIPVFEKGTWESTRQVTEQTLAYLTGDTWEINFRQREYESQVPKEVETKPTVDQVCLFSGGLDSGIGAVDLLADDNNVGLVGHYGPGATKSFQVGVLECIKNVYKNKVTTFLIHVKPPKNKISDGEPSMRSRSFLFFAMGVAVASTVGSGTPLVIAENGLISLNVPLTAARFGSASTRTTHPHYVNLYQKLIRHLSLNIPLELPYRFNTKGEMLKNCKNKDIISKIAPLTISCSHPEAGRYRGKTSNIHCGYCVPCVIRQASTFYAKSPDAEYGIRDMKKTPDHTTDTGRDVRAFQMAILRDADLTLSQAVSRILEQGPLPPSDVKNYAEMYIRGLAEVRNFLTQRFQ